MEKRNQTSFITHRKYWENAKESLISSTFISLNPNVLPIIRWTITSHTKTNQCQVKLHNLLLYKIYIYIGVLYDSEFLKSCVSYERKKSVIFLYERKIQPKESKVLKLLHMPGCFYESLFYLKSFNSCGFLKILSSWSQVLIIP